MNATETLALVRSDDPVLFERCAEVTDIGKQVYPFVPAMRELMKGHHAIGLAAPQVGIPLRFFVTAFPGCKVVVNPVIEHRWGHTIRTPEECLSFPNRKPIHVSRADGITAEWLDGQGVRQYRRLRGIEARCFQHETDHLNGVCIFSNPNGGTP